MGDAYETIDAGRMEILREFPVEYMGEEETLVPHLSTVKRVFIGSLDDLIVFASSGGNDQPTPDLAMDKNNFTLLTEMLEKCLSGGRADENQYVESGADKLGVGVNNNFPQTLTAPFERVYLINLRPIFLKEGDSLDQGYAGLKLPPQGAVRLCAEMKNLLAERKF